MVEQHYITDFTTHMVLILNSLLHSVLFAKTNQLSVEELNVFPYYLSMYTLQFTGISFMCLVAYIIQYLRHSQMRKSILAECYYLFNCIE